VDYGAHLVIDFGFHKFSLEWLSEYVRTLVMWALKLYRRMIT